MLYIVYYFESNKLNMKEEYESAYLISFINTFTESKIKPRNINVSIPGELLIDEEPEIVLLKPYSEECLSIMENDILKIKSSNPKCKIILFGEFSSANYDTLLIKYNDIDAIVIEDLESTINEFIYNKYSIARCPGLVYLKDGRLNINRKPNLLNLDLVPVANREISLEIKQAFAEVQFSKGCLFNCYFCSEAEKKPVRFKTIDLCIEELKYLNKGLGFKYFTLKDSSFEDRNILIGENQLDIFAEKILETEIDIYYTVHFRANSFTEKDRELLLKLRKSGLNNCLVGIESFVDEDLGFYGKGIKGIENINFIKLMRSCYIEPSCSFMFINPLSNIKNIRFNIEQAYTNNLMAFLPPLLNVMKVNKNTLIFKKLDNDEMVYYTEDDIYNLRVRYRERGVQNLADVFEYQFISKKVWDLYYPIKLMSMEVNDLKFKFNSNLLFDKTLLDSIYALLEEIGDNNYKLLLKIIELCERNKVLDATTLFNDYHIEFDSLYSEKLKRLRMVLLKEIKGNEKVQKFYEKASV